MPESTAGGQSLSSILEIRPPAPDEPARGSMVSISPAATVAEEDTARAVDEAMSSEDQDVSDTAANRVCLRVNVEVAGGNLGDSTTVTDHPIGSKVKKVVHLLRELLLTSKTTNQQAK
ncbi:hypothetical protein PsYK624_115710 [Phanerochaete sordida]|uniref:Uncharacterized protein n=1 Tax=Phanerochaete sordida TaxID=48140 RepID=A0A9P3GHY6_9APHY|nr:hypothetical protein PsYK624_115710 [Phanerochaete sordida]